jgi:putative membrane protein insertion efficiency factor
VSAYNPPLARAATPSRAVRLARAIVSAPIRLYALVISPFIPRRCKYEPTCSRYALEAITEFGVLRGTVLAGWRLLRCNPLSHGGYDPVQAQRVFGRRHRASA